MSVPEQPGGGVDAVLAGTRSWLAARRPAPPPALAARMEEALALAASEGGRASSVPMLLEAAAEALLRGVARAPEDGRGTKSGSGSDLRPAALTLLAADALLTYACEAGAEAGEDALREVLAAASPGRLARLSVSSEQP